MQDNSQSKSRTSSVDAKEVEKVAKDIETQDTDETGKMIEEERSETGRVSRVT